MTMEFDTINGKKTETQLHEVQIHEDARRNVEVHEDVAKSSSKLGLRAHKQ